MSVHRWLTIVAVAVLALSSVTSCAATPRPTVIRPPADEAPPTTPTVSSTVAAAPAATAAPTATTLALTAIPTAQPQPTPTTAASATAVPTATLVARSGEYTALDHFANAAELVIVGRLSTAPPATSPARTYPLAITEVVRGRAPAVVRLTAAHARDLQPGQDYILFLTRDYFDPPDTPYEILLHPVGVVPLADGRIAPPPPPGQFHEHVRSRYTGGMASDLLRDIRAIPPVEPAIDALLAQHGWTPLGKGALWPVVLPDRAAFDQAGPPFRSTAASWQMLVAASQRSGLDFGRLAGQEVHLLTYYVAERPARADAPSGVPVIAASVLIHSQQVVGAWVEVGPLDRPFGLDERVAAVAVAPPTPSPTPAVPRGATVNPTRVYGLAAFPHLTLCWPLSQTGPCEPGPRPAELRDAVVRALNQDLPRLERAAHTAPKPGAAAGQAPGDVLGLVFHMDQDWSKHSDRLIGFEYDRRANLLGLPHNGGWVRVPPELVTALAPIAPPAGPEGPTPPPPRTTP